MKFIALGNSIGITVVIITLILIKTFERIDNESKTNINRKNAIVIILAGILFGILSAVFVWKQNTDIIKNTIEILSVSVLFILLVFQSYFDQKTKLVYSTISILAIPLEICYVIYKVCNGYIEIYGIYSLGVLLIPVILWVLSLFRGIGLGDVIIYFVIAVYYLGSRTEPVVSMLLNVIITNILFLVITSINKIIKHDKEKYYPLTMFITIVTLLFTVMGI